MNNTRKNLIFLYERQECRLKYIPFFQQDKWYNIIYEKIKQHKLENKYKYKYEQIEIFNDFITNLNGTFIAITMGDKTIEVGLESHAMFLLNEIHGYSRLGYNDIKFYWKRTILK